MMSLPLDTVRYVVLTTHNAGTGALQNADAAPTYSVYEDNTAAAIVTTTAVTVTALTGRYTATYTMSAANGFEAGKSYNGVALATVSAISGAKVYETYIAEVTANAAGVPNVFVTGVALATALTTVGTNVLLSAQATALATLSGVVALSTQVDTIEASIATSVALATALATVGANVLLAAQATALATLSGVVALSTQVDTLEASIATAVALATTLATVAANVLLAAQATALATLSGVVALSTQVDSLEASIATSVALATALTTIGANVLLAAQATALTTVGANVLLAAQATALATLSGVVALQTAVAAIAVNVTALVAGVVVSAIGTSTAAVTELQKGLHGNVYGTVGVGSSTTNIVTSALSVSASVTAQFQGRIMTFLNDTTTVALRGQATDITSNTLSATPSFTVTALTTAPASTDTFVIT